MISFCIHYYFTGKVLTTMDFTIMFLVEINKNKIMKNEGGTQSNDIQLTNSRRRYNT